MSAPATQTKPRLATRPSLARHLFLGVVAAILSGALDSVVSIWRSGPEATPAERVIAGLHLTAQTLPLGALAGAVVGLLLWLHRRSPWTRSLRGTQVRLFRPEPGLFASGLALLSSAALFVQLGARAAKHFATRYHDPELAAWADGGAGLALLVLALLAAAVLRELFGPIARRVGPLASRGGLALITLAGAGAAVGLVAWRMPRIFQVYDPVRVFWVPGLLAVYALLAALTRRLRHLAFPTLGVLLAFGAVVWSGAFYGESNRARGVVERGSVSGLTLVRLWSRLTDRDHDGHSFAFGGGDCDDFDHNIHPGAPDPEGDGVDADCFDGDGTRVVDELGDGHYGEIPEGFPERPNVLFITIDALRPDHLGCFGYERDTSPTLDEFCERAVRFRSVTAQSSRSIRSIPAMMTGLYPSQIAFGSEYLWPSVLDDENDTLAEVLRRGGWQTGVVAGTNYFERMGGFFQGFATVEQSPDYVPPRNQAVDRALRHLDRFERIDRPWMLWVHLFNVHSPYLQDGIESPFGTEDLDRYDHEIQLADAQFARLMDALRMRRLDDETIVVVASDHGEAFQEHGVGGHSLHLYEEELQATLMVRAPGIGGREVRDPVALFDVMPTVLNLVDLPLPRPVPARSLVPYMTGQGSFPRTRPIFSELMPDGLFPFDQKAVRVGHDKLIFWVRDGTFQLFDLERDPREANDLSDAHRERAEELLDLLRAWITSTNRPENRTADIIAEGRLPAIPGEMSERLDVIFPGLFRFAGYDLNAREFRPGERIRWDFFYEVLGETEHDFSMRVDIIGPPGYPVPPHFHGWHIPLNGAYKTYQWHEGEFLRDSVELVIPRNIQRPVQLQVRYHLLDGDVPQVARFPDGRASTTIDLATIEIR